MSRKKYPINPSTLPHIHIDPEKIKSLSREDSKKFEGSNTYKKYVQPVLDAEKAMKKAQRATWWEKNWLGIVTLIIAILTLIATVLFGLLSLLN